MLLALCAGPPAFGASPLPTFDEEAVRVYPHMRTGDQTIELEGPNVSAPEKYREGTQAQTKSRLFTSNPSN